MRKRFSAFMLLFATAGFALAQDMPPLPPAGNQATVSSDSNTSAPALPALPDQSAAPASSSQASPALPPLPSQPAAPDSTAPALLALPDQTAPANNASPALPPLPGQAAPAPGAAPATPPLPDQAVAPAAPAVTAEQGSPATASAVQANPGKKPVQPWWTKTKSRPNVIFAGWVNPKGGNESSRIAWISQEVLNALVFKGFKVVKEDGKYDGQADAGGHQWREFTFSVPKSKLTTQVYVKQVGKKIFLRVGPSEPPAFAEYSIAQVSKMREVNLKALRLVQKKLGRRLSPHHIVRSFEAPYSYAKDAIIE